MKQCEIQSKRQNFNVWVQKTFTRYHNFKMQKVTNVVYELNREHIHSVE